MSGGAITLSAPGKVLFTGGFLVLDRKHTGLVLGLDARIHVHIEDWANSSAETGDVQILVRSPQFKNASWLYRVDETALDTADFVQQIIHDSKHTRTSNKFVETTIRYVLSYVKTRGVERLQSCRMTILADESYYSQSTTSYLGADGFMNFGCELSAAHKTGLGSSAALVTSLTSALLGRFLTDGTCVIPQHRVHNLAQAAHCAAQGKVGSGFDVAAAVFGACLYRRFTPSILETVGDPTTPGFANRLLRCVDDLADLEHRWDVEISHSAVEIPKSLSLLMCDVDCGSETPGMVRQVLAWRKEKPVEADMLWNAIQEGSNDLCRRLTEAARLEGISREVSQELSDTLLTIRSLVREMSAKSGVPVEPPVITELLDFCSDLPGVIGGVAPGAGGYDAVALFVQNDVEIVESLEKHLHDWKAKQQDTSVSIGRVRLLKARQAYEGVRYEDVGRYSGWL